MLLGTRGGQLLRAKLMVPTCDTSGGSEAGDGVGGGSGSECGGSTCGHVAGSSDAHVRLSTVCDMGGDAPVQLTELPGSYGEAALPSAWMALGTTATLV